MSVHDCFVVEEGVLMFEEGAPSKKKKER